MLCHLLFLQLQNPASCTNCQGSCQNQVVLTPNLLSPSSLTFYRFLSPRPIPIVLGRNNFLLCNIFSKKMLGVEEKRHRPQGPPNGGARVWGVALGAFAAQMYVYGPPNYTFGIVDLKPSLCQEHLRLYQRIWVSFVRPNAVESPVALLWFHGLSKLL